MLQAAAILYEAAPASKRLSAKDVTAVQRHSLGACMPVCLVGLHEMELYIAAWTGMLGVRGNVCRLHALVAQH